MSSISQESTSNETFGKDASIKLAELIGSMSISPSGRDVVLASKEGLRIIDLDSPYSPPRFLPHRTPWEVADVQWSPFADRDYWIVSTSNQKALVWNVNAFGWRNSIEHVLHGHTRAITDINFSAHHPDKLATCAVDSFVHCWDLRCPARPVNSLSDWFAAATQVKWSRQDEHVIASSHDRFLHIWDDRYGARPARTIEAHDTKIYGIDWNRFEPSKIVTCSLDRTIKFWDTKNKDDSPERIINTSFPVWRARHTPFGWGLVVMPQRGNGNIHLYDRRATHGVYETGNVKPVHVFPGHKGQVKEFLWRGMGTVKDGIDHRDFQLVTWGTDRELRLHAVAEDTFADIGYEKGVSKPQRLRFTRRGAKYRTFRDEPTEHETDVAAISRADSFPASTRFLRVRGRPSTNIGMSRVPFAQFKGWLQAGKGNRRTDMHGRGVGRPDTDPISWMKNVKISSWDTDVLADEITAVGEKFKKIDFETVNISQRKATMSLQTSFGELGTSPVYMRLDFKFPRLYPRDAHAIVHIQRTNTITADLQKRLSADINEIAEAYKACGLGCIEGVVRYVLCEQTLEQIVAWTLRDLTESKLIGAADGPGDASDESDDEAIGTATHPTHPKVSNTVPLEKGCAALWADNGRLVCFFKPKIKEPTSLLGSLGTGQLDDLETTRLFGGFGNFQADSPSRKVRDITEAPNGDSASVSSDQSSVFSSSTSSLESSLGIGEKRRSGPWQRPALNPLREKSGDGSQRSTIQDSARAMEKETKQIIKIYDLRDLLPTNEDAAAEYIVHGSVTDASKHNAQVAARHSLPIDSTIWHILGVAFASDNAISQVSISPNVARAASEHRMRSAPPKSEANAAEAYQFISRVRRMAPSQMIAALFQFYERICHTQMLGLLAAIYLQASLEVLKKVSYSESLNAAHSKHCSVAKVAGNHVQDSLYTRNTIVRSHSSYAASPTDENNEPGHTVSTSLSVKRSHHLGSDHTPSIAHNTVAQSISGLTSTTNSTGVSVAGSPENYRFLGKRAQTGTPFTAATASLQALTKSRPPSPPIDPLRKGSVQNDSTGGSLRVSPNDDQNRLSRFRLKSSLSLVNTSVPYVDPKVVQQHMSHPHKLSSLDRSNINVRKGKKKRLKTRLLRPLDGDEVVLHDSQMHELCLQSIVYIRQYIALLDVWQVWMQRSELIKVCAEASHILDQIQSGTDTITVSGSSWNGPNFRWCCKSCGSAMSVVEKNGTVIAWHCLAPKCAAHKSTTSSRQTCTICETSVQGLSIPCVYCGHLTCNLCAEDWFTQCSRKELINASSTDPKSTRPSTTNFTCPAGCGCSCAVSGNIPIRYSTPDDEHLVDTKLAGTIKVSSDHSRDRTNGPRVSALMDIYPTEPRTHRGKSISTIDGGSGSAINALLALNSSARHRSISTAASKQQMSALRKSLSVEDENAQSEDEILSQADDVDANFYKGVGGVLSRGQGDKGSSSTIRAIEHK